MQYKNWIILLFSLTLAFALFSPGAAGGIPSTNNNYTETGTYIQEQLQTLNIPGAYLVIVEGDRIAYTQEFGGASPDGSPPTPQTPFFIGSLTKSFTALAIMQLVEAGKVNLDAPIQEYLPWFALADPQAAAQITVRHLLTQTSGLSTIPGMTGLSDFDSSPQAMERQARALAGLLPANPPGEFFEYSNTNFNLLGLIIEAASGEKYADYLQTHIFTPLDMRRTFTDKSAARQNGLAVGHQLWFSLPIPVPDLPVPAGSLPSGQLISSAEDMGHYLIAQLNAGTYADRQVLSAQGMAQMHEPLVKVSIAGNEMSSYGLGWFINQTGHGPLIFHDGEVPDFFSYMALMPDQDRAMVLLVNANEQVYNYALWNLSENAALKLMDLPVPGNCWGVLPWAMRTALLLPVLQLAAICISMRRFTRWQKDPACRPGVLRLWLLHILLPTLLNLLLVSSAAAILFSGMLPFIMLFMGDIAALLLLMGAIALVWLGVRFVVILKVCRLSHPIE